jgi:hypothetical protein
MLNTTASEAIGVQPGAISTSSANGVEDDDSDGLLACSTMPCPLSPTVMKTTGLPACSPMLSPLLPSVPKMW